MPLELSAPTLKFNLLDHQHGEFVELVKSWT
jgi:hypothetical protein